jgi:type II secretory pathway pseudopilin PulG
MLIKKMYQNLYQTKTKEHGFSLVEAMTAMVLATVIIGVTGPLFMSQRQENVRSELMSGAKSVGVRCLETVRQRSILSLPISATFRTGIDVACAPTTGTTAQKTTELNQMLTQMGTQYTIATRVQVANIDPDTMTNANGDGNFQCSATGGNSTQGSRCITVQVSWNGEVMYSVSSVYSALGVTTQ